MEESEKKSSIARISVQNLYVRRNKKVIVEDLSFEVQAGGVLGIIGPNGAGKSTTLAILAGIEAPDAGRVILDQKDITRYSNTQRAKKIGWVEQSGTVHWPLSVERLIMLGRIPHLPPWSQATEADHDAVESAMLNADCLNLRQRSVSTLSGGERVRVLLARALAATPEILFADEPVSALDLAHQLRTMQLLKDYARNNRAVVVVMHDLSLAARYCDRLLLMHRGKKVAIGEPAGVLEPRNIADVYGVSVLSGCESVPWIIPEHLITESEPTKQR
jgi:iron complex transport system ATP-binding protein